MNAHKRFTASLLALLLAIAPVCMGEPAEESWPIEDWPIEDWEEETAEPHENILLVNADHPLPDDYEPEDLINIYDQPDRYFAVNSAETMICREVFDALQAMFQQARADGLRGFRVTSGYRTAEKQAQLYKSSAEGVAQKSGYSEHQTGLAVDVSVKNGNFGATKQYQWMKKNCWDYGFILRYPKGKEEITGISYEPWHYRYVGVEVAQEIKALHCTLEEYLEDDDQ